MNTLIFAASAIILLSGLIAALVWVVRSGERHRGDAKQAKKTHGVLTVLAQSRQRAKDWGDLRARARRRRLK